MIVPHRYGRFARTVEYFAHGPTMLRLRTRVHENAMTCDLRLRKSEEELWVMTCKTPDEHNESALGADRD